MGAPMRYIQGMRHALLLAASLCLTAPALSAQEDEGEGSSLIEQGARMFMEGLMQEMEPTMRELRGFAEEMGPQLREFADTMGPALAEILGQIEDLSHYHPPEMLPNGDIIIRRKTPQELADEPEPGEEIEI